MSRSADQIALPLDWPQGDDPGRFIVTDCNREAFDHFRRWTTWPVQATLLTGPRRSGRSLLARAFTERVGGRLFDEAERHDEEVLFHAWNRAQETGRPIVLVADRIPPDWGVVLPDLRSRLAATPVVSIGLPDDLLISALIERLFADRGLHLPAEALRFVSTRIARDYLTVERMVEAIDRFSIAERARLSVATVRRALTDAGLLAGEPRQ